MTDAGNADLTSAVGVGDNFSATAAAGSLHEDLKVAYWILVSEARAGRVRNVEAEALIRSLYTTLHARAETSLPLFDVPRPDIYAVAHALNVAMTTIAVAEQLGFAENEARSLGLAALLKDIGQADLPPELLGRTAPLDAAELDRIRRHPIDGARMLISTDEPLELAAVVAYEHHLGPDGHGYPSLAHPRPAHFASRLVRIADAFCALFVRRPHRDAWAFEEVLAHLSERAGVEFDRELTRRFSTAIRALHPNIVRLGSPEQKLPWA
jgi:HD-GYP domain-containing protein (c-di-GMP phosphodiesterase class II)